MKKYLSALTLLSALFAVAVPSANAQSTAPATAKKTDKKKKKSTAKTGAHATSKKAAAKKKTTAHAKTGDRAVAEPHHHLAQDSLTPRKSYAKAATPGKMPFTSDADDDDKEPDLGGTKSADFSCEMGNKLTIYKNDADDKHIAIRWNKKINRLTRVPTTTGANRFENHKVGLVWIGIPAKGILLDSKKGQQLANECKNANPTTAAAPAAATPNS